MPELREEPTIRFNEMKRNNGDGCKSKSHHLFHRVMNSIVSSSYA
jgi:hypothetical protein